MKSIFPFQENTKYETSDPAAEVILAMHAALQEIADLFNSVDITDRLELLAQFGDTLPALDARHRVLRDRGLYIIHECRAPVYFFVDFVDGVASVKGDVPGEAPLARGLVSLLQRAFDGVQLHELHSTPNDILELLGIKTLISLQRRRGLSAIYNHFLVAAAIPQSDSSPGSNGPNESNAGSSSPGAPVVTALVLAAGSSTRMGSDKLLLDFHGKPMLVHVVETILKSRISQVLVVLRNDSESLQTFLASYPVSIIENPQHADGMSSSIHSGVQAAASNSDGYMVCLADQPLIEPDDLNKLLDAFAAEYAINPECIVSPFFEGIRGNPVILARTYRDEMLRTTGDKGCREILRTNSDRILRVEMSTNHVLIDVDTPIAYHDSLRKE